MTNFETSLFYSKRKVKPTKKKDAVSKSPKKNKKNSKCVLPSELS